MRNHVQRCARLQGQEHAQCARLRMPTGPNAHNPVRDPAPDRMRVHAHLHGPVANTRDHRRDRMCDPRTATHVAMCVRTGGCRQGRWRGRGALTPPVPPDPPVPNPPSLSPQPAPLCSPSINSLTGALITQPPWLRNPDLAAGTCLSFPTGRPPPPRSPQPHPWGVWGHAVAGLCRGWGAPGKGGRMRGGSGSTVGSPQAAAAAPPGAAGSRSPGAPQPRA